MIKLIYFIRNETDGAYIYPNRRRSGVSNMSVLRKICHKHLTSFESYLKSIRHMFQEQYQIPIVLSGRYAFFSTKSYRSVDNIWINYLAIKEIIYLDKKMIFIFDEKYQLEVEMTSKRYQRLVSLIFKILKYKESLE